MSYPRRIYTNKNWREFAERILQRDHYKCLQCGRGLPEVTLQVHHEFYIAGKALWEYALSDCRTLCKGCHAREHGLIEPDRGWTLLSIDDRGERDGICEREKCGREIRYEHLTYHPKWGYMVVGSTCIEHLIREDRLFSEDLIKVYKSVSKFIHSSRWIQGTTKQGSNFICSTYKHHKIRIYGEEYSHSFQLVLKKQGIRKHTFGRVFALKGKSTIETKELSYIALKGTISDSEEEKSLLRNLYRELKSNLI